MTWPAASSPVSAGGDGPRVEPPPAKAAEPRRRKGRVGFPKLRASLEREGEEAKRLAAAILEVLAGARTPTDAAKSVGVSLPRYYALEERALSGLLSACERRRRGPHRTPEKEASKLRREVQRLERECTRSQALLRAAQRTVGLSPPEQVKPREPGKRRPRRAKGRALKVARILRSPAAGNALEGKNVPAQDAREVKA